MSKLPRTTVEEVVRDWDDGNLSRASLMSLLLCCAEQYEPNAFLDALPPEHLGEFRAKLVNLPEKGQEVLVGEGFEPPPDSVLEALRAALKSRDGHSA